MNASSKRCEPDMISLEFVEASPQIKLTPSAGMGEGKEGGVTVCEDVDDGPAICVSRWDNS